MSVLYPTYFPNIAFFTVFLRNDAITWEVHGNYQKQSFRNRTYICTDRGKYMLSIPISHLGNHNGKQLNRSVKVDNSYPWQRRHWRTLETAYRTSPFFEFYEDDIRPLYDNTFEYLMEFNLKTVEVICECLQLEMPKAKTERFRHDIDTAEDYRYLADAKANIVLEQENYVQVFGDRHGFIPNLSILDLLFNLGPGAAAYLKKTKLPIRYV